MLHKRLIQTCVVRRFVSTTIDRSGVVGKGISLPIPVNLPTLKVWKSLLIKIKQPELFLPAIDVTTRLTPDGLGTYREMTVDRKRIIEDIYADDENHEIRFVVKDHHPPVEHINVINTDKTTGARSLEFYQRNPVTKERIPWDFPKAAAIGAIEKVFDMASII